MSLFRQNSAFPNLVETQRNSFRRFLERGIGEELLAISKIHGDRAQRVHKQKLKTSNNKDRTYGIFFR